MIVAARFGINERTREEKEKEKRSQLRRHVANCRGLEGNRWRRWRRLREGRSGERIDREDEARERAMYATAIRRHNTLRGKVEAERRPVICDSKRAIHLATCQDSIGGICLWNQSRRTLPSLIASFVSSSCLPCAILRLSQQEHDKIQGAKRREWKTPEFVLSRKKCARSCFHDVW